MNAHQKSKVAFVVVGWNNKNILEECFESIAAQSYPHIITVYVDNDSSDESADWVEASFPDVIVLRQARNTGFARGNNIGMAEALKDPDVAYIALLNSDARVASEWTEKMVAFADMKPKGALYQGTNLDYYNHSVIDSTHIYVSQNGQGTQGNWRYFVTQEKGPKKVFGVNAAACLISRKFIEAQPFGHEFFDEAMFMYLEDVDVAARATVMGWDNYLVPAAKAYHMGSASSGKNPGFSLYMTFRNNTGMLFKNLPLKLLIRILPKLVRGDIETVRTLRRRGKKSAARKVIKGRLTGIIRLPLFFHKRVVISRHRRLDTDYLWSLMRKGY